jgi:hypothetical protein
MPVSANPFILAEQRYRQLLALHQQGQLSAAQLQQQQEACVVQDAQGRRWFPSSEVGRWLLWDGQQWTLYEAHTASPSPDRRLPIRQRGLHPVALQKKRRGWIGWLVGGILLLLILGTAGLFLWYTPLPEQWGLRPSTAVRVLEQPERETAAELALELSQERDTPGVFYYVLPVKNSTNKILYVVADASAGFDGISAIGSHIITILDYMAQLALSEVVTRAGITRIALEYHDEKGVELGVLTARTTDFLAFAHGEMNVDELLQVMYSRVNRSQLSKEVQP